MMMHLRSGNVSVGLCSLLAALLFAPSALMAAPVAKDVAGEVLVLDRAESPDPWNTKLMGATAVGVKSETQLVREGAAAVRWKCNGIERERFGFTIAPERADWSGYDQVQFWCHSGKHTAASIRPVVLDGKAEYRASIRINWEGWRLITVPKERFGKDDSWSELAAPEAPVAWTKVRGFGFEEHTYREMGFFPLVDTDLTIDGVVLSRKILSGSIANEIGPQKNPFVYVVRVKNLSDTARTCRLSVLQQRGPNPADELKVKISPETLKIAAGAEATAEVTVTVDDEMLAEPGRLRGLVASIYATLDDQAIPQLEFRLPAQRLYFDSLKLSHPRLYVDNEKLAAIKELVKTDKAAAKMWKTVKKDADKALTKKVAKSGDRRNRLGAMVTLAFAYRMTGDEKYAERARDYLKFALKIPVMNQAMKPSFPRATDLASGHMAMHMGIAYDWLYDFWTPAERDALRNLIVEKSLVPHYEDCRIRYAWGHPYNSNWTAVVTGGTAVGALAVLGDDPDASKHVEMGLQRMERVLEEQGIDGSNAEGTSYWNYNIEYCNAFADALRTTTGGKMNLYQTQPFYRKTCDYYLGTQMPEGQWANFADAWHAGYYRGPIKNPELNVHFLRMASEFRDGYLQWKAQHNKGGLWGLVWYDPTVKPVQKETRPLAQHFRGCNFVVLRAANGDTDAVAMAMRGGSNSEGHGHFDIFNFVVSGYGYQVAADLGPSKYSADGYFGHTRHLNKLAGTFGHNCILVNGEGQIWGREVYGRFENVFHSEVADYIRGDGSSVYSAKLLSKWKRNVLFVRPRYFVMWDELASPEPVEYRWSMQTWSEERDPPKTTKYGAVATTCAYAAHPDKAGQIKVAHAAWPVAHKTTVERSPYDPKVNRNPTDKRRGYYLKTVTGEKTDKWILMTMLFPTDRDDSAGRGEFEPIAAEGVLAAKISDAKVTDGPDIVAVNVSSGKAVVGEISFRGAAMLVSGEKETTRYVLINGTELVRGDITLISADKPVTAALAKKDGKWVGSIQADEDANVTFYGGGATGISLTINDKKIELPRGTTVKVKVPASSMQEFLSHQGEKIGYQAAE